MSEDNLLSLSYGRIVRKDIQTNDGLLPESFETYQIIRPGDVVLRLTDLQNDKRSLRSALVEERGIITSAYLAIQPTKIETRFLAYLLRAYDLTKVFYSMGGGLRQSMKFTDMKRMPMVIPSDEEQTDIAAFLDLETGKIDALISEQEKLLTLLAEKRQATISHVVTRGLNPDAPMKDSGLAWLGEVPAHWDVLRIKRVITSIEQGWSPQCENFPVEGVQEWGVMKVGCVNGGVFDASENKKLPSELAPIPEYSLRKGDLLISRANTRELVGSSAVVPDDFENLLLCDKLYRIRTNLEACMPDFLAAFLSIPVARAQIELKATGASSSMLNIAQSVILELSVPFPDVTEQSAIMEFISAEINKLDNLKAGAERTIDLLTERRSALITAAVTGKIDVRDAVPQGLAA
ncbi:restriction endonuclease subunit S [Burkholderia cepacia]|uniref:restriction endonuclease subunit S n=1 Tax=Burkholderia cepacia TaxID=292 RepID=UPI001CF1AD0D|nr:restriction endonuclease subunit S [Burkholderia cepacia]MCA8058225.1 restriction endonuclease subunit S [Burkholderia cepacia]HEM7895229.1 restriction endonuclease subunit S [Burkholderia cepacia]HEM8515495.1 restriction endonuclease subunit S [Burkholderia cepacia]